MSSLYVLAIVALVLLPVVARETQRYRRATQARREARRKAQYERFVGQAPPQEMRWRR